MGFAIALLTKVAHGGNPQDRTFALPILRTIRLALRRGECKILQDDLESLYMSWFQRFVARQSTQKILMSYFENRDLYIQQALQHHNAD